jgi:hypothetical protein
MQIGPADCQADGLSKRLTSRYLKQGNPMKKIVLAAALLMISASAHAGTYNYEGVTVRLQDGCRSSSCVTVYAPGYGYYHGGNQVKVHKAHKDTARIASTRKEGAAAAAAAPAMEATPAKAPEAAPSDAAPSDAAAEK